MYRSVSFIPSDLIESSRNPGCVACSNPMAYCQGMVGGDAVALTVPLQPVLRRHVAGVGPDLLPSD